MAGWPLHALFAAASAGALVFAQLTGQPAVVDALLVLALHYVVGVWAGYAVHELGHAAALSRSPGVTALTLERSLLRVSVVPHGSLSGREAFIGAVSGPLSCVAIGAVLWMLVPQVHLHGWYLMHAIFLTPVFADGRVALRSLRHWRSGMHIP
ncbi:hypothetical protein AB3M89_10225 [Microbacterium sp. 179-I 3D2 NHS]|uniref:hypothetical protein n=1 Tax=Microbacterium sp. 179-I 3D2 NHS TaxID=3235178 RepID=UPI0039A0D17F